MNHVTVHKDGVYFGTFENRAMHLPLPISFHQSNPKKSEPTSAATWAELHRYIPLGTSDDFAWLNQFTLRVLTGSCQCRNHWIDHLAIDPPDFNSALAWFKWTVRAHNAVNQRLGKQILSIEEAQRIWK